MPCSFPKHYFSGNLSNGFEYNVAEFLNQLIYFLLSQKPQYSWYIPVIDFQTASYRAIFDVFENAPSLDIEYFVPHFWGYSGYSNPWGFFQANNRV